MLISIIMCLIFRLQPRLTGDQLYLYILLDLLDLDLLSFVSTLSLYIQAMVISIWLLIKINDYVIHAVSSISLIPL